MVRPAAIGDAGQTNVSSGLAVKIQAREKGDPAILATLRESPAADVAEVHTREAPEDDVPLPRLPPMMDAASKIEIFCQACRRRGS
jgi:hypothetical protein